MESVYEFLIGDAQRQIVRQFAAALYLTWLKVQANVSQSTMIAFNPFQDYILVRPVKRVQSDIL